MATVSIGGYETGAISAAQADEMLAGVGYRRGAAEIIEALRLPTVSMVVQIRAGAFDVASAIYAVRSTRDWVEKAEAAYWSSVRCNARTRAGLDPDSAANMRAWLDAAMDRLVVGEREARRLHSDPAIVEAATRVSELVKKRRDDMKAMRA